MRLRNIKDKDELLLNCKYLIRDPASFKGEWRTVFDNDNPIHIEIGMGKGDFIYNMALKYPNINFIGIEKYSSVIVRAIKKYPEGLPNLRIIVMDALNIKDVFYREIDTLYLNFSDPWPKAKHEKRRLTSLNFLVLYEEIFTFSNKIIMKTDNIELFAYSLVSLSNFGYRFEDVNLDLTNSDIPNVRTEYENKFISEGVKINYLVATKKLFQ